MADAELEGAFHDLHKAREALAAEDARACHDFRVSLLGGAWLMEAKGRAYDAFQGSAIWGEGDRVVLGVLSGAFSPL